MALLRSLKKSEASAVVRPVKVVSFLSGWYLRASCRYCTLISIPEAPRPRPRIINEWDMLRPTKEQKVGSLSHCFELYEVVLATLDALGSEECGGVG